MQPNDCRGRGYCISSTSSDGTSVGHFSSKFISFFGTTTSAISEIDLSIRGSFANALWIIASTLDLSSSTSTALPLPLARLVSSTSFLSDVSGPLPRSHLPLLFHHQATPPPAPTLAPDKSSSFSCPVLA